MVHLNPNTSISTLNVSGLTTPIKRQRLSEWIKEHARTSVYKKLIANITGQLEVKL